MLNFLGIGAQKCATTWLYEQLRRHPGIGFPGGKEVHFWDSQRPKGIAWWLGLFPETPGLKQGEITPAYAMMDHAAIRSLYAAAPGVRLFYSIRNPIARAWSSALMAMGRAEMTLEDCSNHWFMDHFNSGGSRRRGDYGGCLDHWLAVFPEEQLHLIFFDDILGDPLSVMVGLSGHIGVDGEYYREGVAALELGRPVFKGPDVDLRPELLYYLRRIYGPEIHALSNRLQRDLSAWLAWDGRRSG